ncbi:D-alanyl-D-alanine carboxypeptidase [Streptoalloteichus hindustanus]|uniref:D-alanyl-D-alanine carboxypeptidase n=1 Tax=Streptoalloteichus hindustanus TaxID=2017 RepID=A0A1M5Q2G9_STRHI|nr:D-alanyl-D-alanine carboxypeptidase [Streptoalloteichus hindustanus]
MALLVAAATVLSGPAALASVPTSPPAPAAATADQADRRAAIQRELDRSVAEGAPGATALVAEGSTRWRTTSGVADLDTRAPMPADGRFRAASLTKSMVATVVLQLVDERRLRLADPVASVLPGVVPRGDRITVEQLLRHTSGLPDYINVPEMADPAVYGRRTFTPRQLVDFALRQAPVGEPGQKFSYSNANYILLGMIIERLTGGLADALRERVFGPADMRASYFPVTFPFLVGPHASGYYLAAGRMTKVTELNPSFAWAAYAVVSTPSDIQRFYRALLTGRLLPARLVETMRVTVPTGKEPWSGYGLGLETLKTTCGVTAWGHTGSIPGFVSMAFSSEDGQRQVIATLNVQSADREFGKIAMPVLNAVNTVFCGVPYVPTRP